MSSAVFQRIFEIADRDHDGFLNLGQFVISQYLIDGAIKGEVQIFTPRGSPTGFVDSDYEDDYDSEEEEYSDDESKGARRKLFAKKKKCTGKHNLPKFEPKSDAERARLKRRREVVLARGDLIPDDDCSHAQRENCLDDDSRRTKLEVGSVLVKLLPTFDYVQLSYLLPKLPTVRSAYVSDS